jgi:hypothetical protein
MRTLQETYPSGGDTTIETDESSQDPLSNQPENDDDD